MVLWLELIFAYNYFSLQLKIVYSFSLFWSQISIQVIFLISFLIIMFHWLTKYFFYFFTKPPQPPPSTPIIPLFWSQISIQVFFWFLSLLLCFIERCSYTLTKYLFYFFTKPPQPPKQPQAPLPTHPPKKSLPPELNPLLDHTVDCW